MLTARQAQVLQAVHARPGRTRVEVARQLGLSSGGATEVIAALSRARLLGAGARQMTGVRGRPTRVLGAHPQGPVVLAAAVTYESWEVVAVELGGGVLARRRARHAGARDQDGESVLAAVAAVVSSFSGELPGRVRGLGLSVPGVVREGHLLSAHQLGWKDLDLRAAGPSGDHHGGVFVADNDATLAAVAEARRGAAVGVGHVLHLHIDVGLGGALLQDGEVLTGASGMAGEFGHMPFEDPSLQCPCGARGCWGRAVDGDALARLLGEPAADAPVTYAKEVLARAEAGETAARDAVAVVAGTVGRGTAALVNALDPELILLGGLGADLLHAAPAHLRATYFEGLMSVRRSAPPALAPAALGHAGPLTGAAEAVWDRLWSRL